MAGLDDFRKSHPEYNDMPDAALSDAIYKKFYADMPRQDFDAKMGGGVSRDQFTTESMRGAKPPLGPITQGNVNLLNRPRVPVGNGDIATVRSMSFGADGKEVLVPTVSDDGRIMPDEEAIQAYRGMGRNLGTFGTPTAATAYAEALHKDQERLYTKEQKPRLTMKSLLENPNTPLPMNEYMRAKSDPRSPGRQQAVVQGMTLGFGDEISGGLAGLSAKLKGRDYMPAYEAERDQSRKEFGDYTKDNPIESLGQQFIGGLPLSMVMGLLKAPQTIGQAVMQGGAVGGAVGGAYGFGSGEGGVGNRAINAAKVGIPSAVVGAATPLVIEGGKRAGNAIGNLISERNLPPEAKARALMSRAVSGDKASPENMQQVMDRFTDKSIAPIDVGGRKVQRLARTVTTLGGEGDDEVSRFLMDRQADQHARVVDDIAKNLADGSDVHSVTTGLIDSRDRAAKPLYRAAFEENQNISGPEIDKVLGTPAGKRALASARVKMLNDMSDMGEMGSASPSGPMSGLSTARSGGDPKESIYDAIRRLGGIKTKTNAGARTPEGGDVRFSLKDVRTRGVINDQSGLPADTMHGILEREGWFGRQAKGNLDDLYDAMKGGREYYHPEATAASRVGEANAREIEDAMALAGDYGIPYQSGMSTRDVEAAIGGAERGSVAAGGSKPGLNLRTLDYVKRALDDQIGSAKTKGLRDDVRIITGLKKQLVSAVDSADTSGLYKEARAAFSGPSQSVDAIEEGGTFLKMRPEEIGAHLKGLGKGDADFFRIGAARALQDKVNSAGDNYDAVSRVFGNNAIRSQIEAAFGKGSVEKFAEAMTAEKLATQSKNFVMGGSNTANKLADVEGATTAEKAIGDALKGYVTGGARGAIRLPLLNMAQDKMSGYFSGISPEVRSELARILTQQGRMPSGIVPQPQVTTPSKLKMTPFVSALLARHALGQAQPNTVQKGR